MSSDRLRADENQRRSRVTEGARSTVSGWRNVVLPLAVSVAFTLLLFVRIDKKTMGSSNFPGNPDITAYVELARDPFTTDFLYFSYRLLGPTLAHFMPFDLQTNFMILSFFGLASTGTVVFFIAREIGIERATAVLGIAMFFSLSWATEYNVYEFWRPEPLAFLFLALAFYALLVDSDALFVLSLSFGVAAKESVALVGPFYYFWHASSVVDWERIKRTAVVGVVPFAVFVAIRVFHPPFGSPFVEYYADQVANVLSFRRQRMTLRYLHEWVLQPHGLVLPLALLGVYRKPSLARRFAPFVALVYVQWFLTKTTQRHFVMAFPALVVLALYGTDYVTSVYNDVFGTTLRPVHFTPVFLGLLLFETRPYQFFPIRFYVQCLFFVGFSAVAVAVNRVVQSVDKPTV